MAQRSNDRRSCSDEGADDDIATMAIRRRASALSSSGNLNRVQPFSSSSSTAMNSFTTLSAPW
jgi:hypothetical protein